MRTKVLTLVATALAVVGIGVLPSLASAATPDANVQGGSFAASPPVKSECGSGSVCFWSGKTWGRAECQSGQNCFSQFHANETGFHALANINPQSMWNNTTNRTAVIYEGIFGEVEVGIGPGESWQWSSRYERGFYLH
jgi:hypothetical protein